MNDMLGRIWAPLVLLVLGMGLFFFSFGIAVNTGEIKTEWFVSAGMLFIIGLLWIIVTLVSDFRRLQRLREVEQSTTTNNQKGEKKPEDKKALQAKKNMGVGIAVFLGVVFASTLHAVSKAGIRNGVSILILAAVAILVIIRVKRRR